MAYLTTAKRRAWLQCKMQCTAAADQGLRHAPTSLGYWHSAARLCTATSRCCQCQHHCLRHEFTKLLITSNMELIFSSLLAQGSG